MLMLQKAERSNNKFYIASLNLLSIQFFRSIAPILLVPILARILSVQDLGTYLTFQAYIVFSISISEFGFLNSITYKISQKLNDSKYINCLVTTAFILKLSFSFMLSFLPFIYFVFSANFELAKLFVYPALIVFFNSLQWPWYFHGFQKLLAMNLIIGFEKIGYLLFVYFISKSGLDLGDVLIVQTVWSVGSSFGLFVIYFLIGGRLVPVSRKLLKDTVGDGVGFFFSKLIAQSYTSLNVLIVGLFSNVQASYYGVAEKFLSVIQSLVFPISQALFPHLAKYSDVKLFFIVVQFLLICVLGLSTLIFIYSDSLVLFIFGSDYVEAGNLLRVFSLVAIFNFLAVVFGYPAFSLLGSPERVNKTVLIGFFVHLSIVSVSILTSTLDAKRMIISLFLAEFFTALTRVYLFFKIYLGKKEVC